MTCADCREALSARLDDEELPEQRAEVDAHLAGCADCRRYAERAAHITRLARTELVEPVPDVVAAVRHAVPGPPARMRWETGLRLLLAGIGVGQLGLATSDVLAAADEHHGADAMSGASLAHFSHESSAWNLALAVGFLCVAARPARTRGMVPLVAAFVGVLTALSVVDLVSNRVEGSRLLSHALVVVGLFALLGLARVAAHRPSGAPDVLDEPFPGGLFGGADNAGDPVRYGPYRSDGDHDLKPSARRQAA